MGDVVGHFPDISIPGTLRVLGIPLRRRIAVVNENEAVEPHQTFEIQNVAQRLAKLMEPIERVAGFSMLMVGTMSRFTGIVLGQGNNQGINQGFPGSSGF